MNTLRCTTRRTPPRRSERGGFTLIELTLAMVLGSMVLMGTLGVFMAMRNMENTFSARFERTSEMDITHTVMSRAMLSLQMEEPQNNPVTRASTSTQSGGLDENDPASEPPHRPRMILETDPSAVPDSSGWSPQRFELVTALPPVPAGMATQAAGWYLAQSQSDSLDFSAMDGSQGAVRGVFELRQTGQREKIMQQLGLLDARDPILGDSGEQQPTQEPSGFNEIKPSWTLWWRPILTHESEQFLAGASPMSDSVGAPDDIRARLAGAVPIMRGIERCRWQLFKGDEYVDAYSGLTMGDLPAYAQFEVFLNDSQYASWMFEVDWVLGDDPSIADATDESTDENTDNAGDNANRPPNNGNGSDNGRPGRGNDPTTTNKFNLNGDS